MRLLFIFLALTASLTAQYRPIRPRVVGMGTLAERPQTCQTGEIYYCLGADCSIGDYYVCNNRAWTGSVVLDATTIETITGAWVFSGGISTGSSGAGTVAFKDENDSYSTTLKGADSRSASLEMKFPATDPTATVGTPFFGAPSSGSTTWTWIQPAKVIAGYLNMTGELGTANGTDSICLGSILLPAAEFNESGRVYRIKGSGYLTTGAGPGTPTFVLSLSTAVDCGTGNTAIASISMPSALLANQTNGGWEVEGDIGVVATGASATIWTEAIAKSILAAAFTQRWAQLNTALNIDTTGTYYLNLAIANTAGDTTTTYTQRLFTVTRVK